MEYPPIVGRPNTGGSHRFDGPSIHSREGNQSLEKGLRLANLGDIDGNRLFWGREVSGGRTLAGMQEREMPDVPTGHLYIGGSGERRSWPVCSLRRTRMEGKA